jgi:hypothetical protein
MNFKLPEPAWERLDVVCKRWKASQNDVLKLAADSALQLHAFVKPHGIAFYRLEGCSEAWGATTPVIVPADIADRLIHESYVEVAEWVTKDGARWESAIGMYQRGLQISVSNLVVFREECQRFEREHAEPVEPAKPATTEPVDLSESERNKLLRQIGGLAMALAEKHGTYRRGGVPNASQIANTVDEIFELLPDASTFGAGDTSLRTSIAKGLKLLQK